MDVLDRAYARSQAITDRARDIALDAKQRTLPANLFSAEGTAFTGPFAKTQGDAAMRERYRLYRGWAYSAIHALAEAGAGQPVCAGHLMGPQAVSQERSAPTRKKYLLKQMPKTIRHKAAREEIEILQAHSVLTALQNPNDWQFNWQFVYNFITNLNLTGRAFVIGGETESGELEFYSVPSSWVKIGKVQGELVFFVQNPKNVNEEPIPIPKENVAFAQIPNPSDPTSSLAPAAAQAPALRIDDFIQQSQQLFFENGVFPSTVVTIGNNPMDGVAPGVRPRLSGAQRRQVTSAIQKVMGSFRNYGTPAIVDGLIEKIERFSPDHNEIGWEKSENTVRNRILSAFGVHPFILGETAPSSYAQAYVIQLRFCERVNTHLDMLSTIMTHMVGPLVEETNLLVWWKQCEVNDPSLRQKAVLDMRKNGDIDQNEIRAEFGFSPDDDRNEAILDRQILRDVNQLLVNTGSGLISQEQSLAVLEAMGLPDELARRISGVDNQITVLAEAVERTLHRLEMHT